MTTEKTAQDEMVPMGAEGAQGEAEAPTSGNPNFERSFADLAYAHLKDKAPKLLDFLVGFQVMDKNDDETKAAGVFGFQVGKQWFYAPVFFLNGELKGHDLLYIKEQDAFVPLQENWVNYLISRKPAILGESESRSEGELGIRAPNYWTYSRSPIRNSWNKLGALMDGAADPDEIHGRWHNGTSFDLRPVLDVMGTSVNSEKYAKAAERMDLSRVVRELGTKAAKFLVTSIKQEPRYASALGKFYAGSELVPQTKEAAATVVRPPSDRALHVSGLDRGMFKHYATKLAQSGYLDIKGTDRAVVRVLSGIGVKSAAHLRDNLDIVISEPERMAVKQAADPTLKVEVVSRSEAMDAPASLTDDERTEIMEEGFIVRDDRSDDEKTKVYDVDMTDQLSNPDGSGVYDMLSKDGKTHEVVIIDAPVTIGAGVAEITLVLKTDGKGWVGADSKAIIVRKDKTGDWRPFYDKLPDIQSMSEGNTYVILCADCTSSLVINVVEKAGDDLYVNVPHCSCDISTVEPRGTIKDMWSPKVSHEYPTDSLDESTYKDDKKWWRNSVRKVAISDKVGKLKPIGDTLLVPSDAKVLKLSSGNSGLGFIPGSITDAELTLLKGAGLDTLRVYSDGLGYQIDDGVLGSRMQDMDLIRTLVNSHGVTKTAARLMKSRADDRGTDTFHVKYAGGYGLSAGGPLTPGPAAPPVSVLDNNDYYDQELGVMTNQGEISNEPANLPLSSQEDYNPMEVDPATSQAAVQAAETGQKEVLDTSVLSSMVKAMDTDPLIDKYLADLVVGEDRIGRILFMFYWHNEKFRDRYGDDEMKELEDALNNTFKSVGDLVLFLKKRTIEPDAALTGSDVDLDALG